MARRPALNLGITDTHSPTGALVTDFTKTENDVGLAPWQKAGTALGQEALTYQQVLERSGNAFKVATVPAFAKVGEVYIEAKNQRMVVREDTGHVLGTVGTKYHTIQNETQIQAIAPLVDSGFAKYDTAGLVDGGRIGWVMLKINQDVTLPGNDRVLSYLMALWSHDGLISTRFFPSPMRAFCANVLSSLIAGATNGISVRHTSSAADRMQEAARVIEASNGFYNNFQARATKLMTTRMADGQMNELASVLFPAMEENGAEKVSTRSKNMREKLFDLFVNGAGHETANIRGTAWAGYNAVAEFADHHRSTRTTEGREAAEARFQTTMMGAGAQLKAKAIKWIDTNVLLEA
jgi:phage/plasmid-like protein (TIGR03299 family)